MAMTVEDTEASTQIAVKSALGDGQHLDIFIRAVTNILNTELAELTYAQIIDGLPLEEVVLDSGGPETTLTAARSPLVSSG